ncbi:hypothetical protein DFH08DRAFT_957652 [Mycena albidolilacea]|uniref:CxC6 like cysteine cluster associated with KDZ domain-containing protein n=1 Tax=Mycena albidolilacea TaxID=1033008 RepID=A0AAD7A7I0_9AGAR|nr:hypothetical protein DFH08DRAFT_957652 [Mycena albidolilacea]
MEFVRLAARLKDAILTAQPPSHDASQPPDEIPAGIRTFLGSAIDIPIEYIDGCWKAFGNLVWTYNENGKTTGTDAEAFKNFGLDHLLSAHMLFPPTRYCTSPRCSNRKMLRDKDGASKVVLYTLSDALKFPFGKSQRPPEGCHARYYPNYVVRDGIRTYYDKIPDAIQVGEHQYVDRTVLKLFLNLMLISWTSATNGARVYDTSLSQPESFPDHPDWMETSFKLRPEHVWDGVIILSLLEDHEARTATLQVPHTGDQRDRFTAAMEERNTRIQLCGQPEWGHCCNKFLRVWETDGKIRKIHVVVIDGVTIGHPCCGVLHCPIPLALNRHRFCPHHAPLRDKVCAVEGCETPAEFDQGFKTCSDSNHRLLETNHKKRDKAMFQLRTHVARPGVANPENAFAAETTAEEIEELDVPADTTDPACPASKDPSGNRKIRALFGRRKTHNEQIIVRPCGVIVARATFFGSVTVTQTVDMLRKVFRTEGSMPDIVFYDNNCTLYKHLARINDPLIETVGFPVDVFHWQCKHKKEGVECSYHCSPLQFPELIGADGTGWYFNSSIAEQTNVWLGGFHAILREMGATKFNFFLDEMILRKNRLTVTKLEADGSCPNIRPNLSYNGL